MNNCTLASANLFTLLSGWISTIFLIGVILYVTRYQRRNHPPKSFSSSLSSVLLADARPALDYNNDNNCS